MAWVVRDLASTAASSPRNENYRVHPAHWYISTQVSDSDLVFINTGTYNNIHTWEL